MANLLNKIGIGAILTASIFLYQGCAEPISYRDKEDSLRNQLEQRERTRDYDSPVIVSVLKLKKVNFNN